MTGALGLGQTTTRDPVLSSTAVPVLGKASDTKTNGISSGNGGRSAVESLSQSLAAKWDSKGFGGGSFSSRYSGED